jgi:hypothetical protein
MTGPGYTTLVGFLFLISFFLTIFLLVLRQWQQTTNRNVATNRNNTRIGTTRRLERHWEMTGPGYALERSSSTKKWPPRHHVAPPSCHPRNVAPTPNTTSDARKRRRGQKVRDAMTFGTFFCPSYFYFSLLNVYLHVDYVYDDDPTSHTDTKYMPPRVNDAFWHVEHQHWHHWRRM